MRRDALLPKFTSTYELCGRGGLSSSDTKTIAIISPSYCSLVSCLLFSAHHTFFFCLFYLFYFFFFTLEWSKEPTHAHTTQIKKHKQILGFECEVYRMKTNKRKRFKWYRFLSPVHFLLLLLFSRVGFHKFFR